MQTDKPVSFHKIKPKSDYPPLLDRSDSTRDRGCSSQANLMPLDHAVEGFFNAHYNKQTSKKISRKEGNKPA
jgi:hypothetical protein